MRELTLDEFSGHEGESFELLLDEKPFALTLAKVQSLPPTRREAGAFTLEWLGPPEPVLAQAIYSLRRGDDLFEMFIVPIVREPDGVRYEAVFN